MSRSLPVLPALKRTFASTRYLALALVATFALLFGAQQAHATDYCSGVSGISGENGPTYIYLTINQGDVVYGTLTGTETVSLTAQSSSNSVSYSYPANTSFSYTIPATDQWKIQWSTSNFTIACAPPQTTYTVTTSADDASGVVANCTTGSTTPCTLRDALAAAAASTVSSSSQQVTIQFSPTVFTAATTITEANGTLNIPNYTTIQGLTTGSGATLTNLITVSGNSGYTVFTVARSVTGAVINNLTITKGYTATTGAGINNAGTLTVNQSTIEDSNSNDEGGGINNSGTLTLSQSTLSGNSAVTGGGLFNTSGSVTITASTIAGNSAYDGGGILVYSGTVTISYSTISANTATSAGGGIILNAGTLNLSNSILAGNWVSSNGTYADFYNFFNNGTFNNISNNLVYTGSSPTTPSGSAPSLPTLGNYGGPTQTMPSVPSSLSFCTTSTGSGTDQRGIPRPSSYIGASTIHCNDIGATNSDYSLAWTTEPVALPATYYVNTDFSPAPVLQFEDDSFPLPDSGLSIALTDYYAPLNAVPIGQISATTGSSGSITLSSDYVPTAVSGDYLTAYLQVSSSQGTIYLASSSTTYSAVVPVNHFAFTAAPPSSTTAGTSFSVTVTAYSSTDNSAVATNYTGPIKFTSTDSAAVFPTGTLSLTAGVGTFNITLKTAGTQTITVADSSGSPSTPSGNIAVSAAAAATITAATGSGQSATIGAAFTNPLVAQVLDAYSNPIGGNVVTFTVPTTGASATLSNSTCTTSATATPVGSCSVTATANGTASSTAYTVSAKATSITTPASFSLTNNKVTPALTVTASPTTLVYGQPVTITATSVPASAGGSAPTGAVTFYDNTTTLTPTSTPASGVATYATTALVGSQTYAASTAGDTNFSAVTKTSATAIVVGKASSTLTGPTTQPVQITVNTSGSIPITVTGQYSGTGVNAPSGSIGYTIGTPCTASCTGTAVITSGAATIPTPSTLVSGPYTVAVTYAGDTNYNAAMGINVSIQIGQITPTVTYPSQTAITYGAALTNNLNATVTYNSNSVASLGTTAYTATLQPSGTPVTVTAGTVLAAGTYTLTATWTPSSGNTATYKSSSNTTTLVVNKAPLTVTANAITITYGQTLPSYTATITGFVNGDTVSVVSGSASLSTSPTTPSAVGTYPITPAVGTLTASNYTFTTFTPANLTINQAGVTVTLVPNRTTGNSATTFNYTATVTSATTGTPTGTVTITATPTSGGPFSYGPYTLVAGVATGSGRMTGAGNGSVTVTASYSGDPNFVANVGSTFVTLGTANYTLAASPSSLTVTRGTPSSTTITMTPLNGYVGTASFNCGNMPAYASCVFTPSSITTTDGLTPQTAVMTIYTLAPSAQPGVSASMLWIPGAMIALLVFFVRKKMNKRVQQLLMLLLLAALAMGATGCGSRYDFATPTGSDNISINVSAIGSPGTGSSNLNQSLNLSVTIQ